MDALSSRVRGAARALSSLERPLRQAYPLTVLMIVALENVANLAPYDHWRIIARHMLLCLGSCSRFRDSMRLSSLSANSHHGFQTVEAEPKLYKTMKGDSQGRLLPLIGLGKIFAKTPWAVQWMDLRAQHGLGLDPALPAWSEISQTWLKRRMTTGEAQLFLKEFMASSGFNEDELKGGWVPLLEMLPSFLDLQRRLPSHCRQASDGPPFVKGEPVGCCVLQG